MLRRPPSTLPISASIRKLCATVGAMASLVLCTNVNAADSDSFFGSNAVMTDVAGPSLVTRALSFLGVNYRFGGTDPRTGLDCSGLVQLVFRDAAGVRLPRRAEEISRSGERIDSDGLQPGDLVFFNTLRQAFSHVGIYIGNDQFVHAPSTGGQVRVESLNTRYWRTRFDGARRVVDPETPLRTGPRAVQDLAWRPSARDPAWRPPVRDQKAFDQLLESLAPRAREARALGARGADIQAGTPPSPSTAMPAPPAVPAAMLPTSLSSPVNPPGILN